MHTIYIHTYSGLPKRWSRTGQGYIHIYTQRDTPTYTYIHVCTDALLHFLVLFMCFVLCFKVRSTCVCMFVCINGYEYVCMYACVHQWLRVCMYVCLYASMVMSMYVCMYVCLYASMYAYLLACMVLVDIHVCIYTHMYMYNT